MNSNLVIGILIGYILGSIPFALVIGKVFYHTDIRNYGSGNLGGTNAGRILGKKAGIAVIFCDVLKVVVAVYIMSNFFQDNSASIWAGVAAAFGHCYPVFAQFKGGKAAATLGGFLLSTALYTFHDAKYFMIPVIAFFITLYCSKMVSLASITLAIVSSIYITMMQSNQMIIFASWILSALVIYRHRENIKKIRNKTERKITWM